MLFNSLEFLIFFPVVTIAYFLLPYRFRGPLLLVASCLFYAGFIPGYLLILFFLIAIDFWVGQAISSAEGRARFHYLLLSIVANAGMLFFFKYFNFFNENLSGFLALFGTTVSIPHIDILLPLGLSFHVFQSMSYTIEVYRGKFPAEKNLLTFALYVMFYPQLVAGPIERPSRLLPQLHFHYDFNYMRVVSGLRLMGWGFFKKVIIADRAAIIVDAVYKSPDQYQGPMLMLATGLFAYQLYCDFSGYTDIARGAARVMGIHLVPNFNFPYAAKSMNEFWKKWHISLTSWIRDYVYMPFAVYLRGWGAHSIVMGLFLSFLFSGFWHGARWTFVVWGVLHGIVQIFEFLTQKLRSEIGSKLPKVLVSTVGHVYVFIFWSFSLIYFRAHSLSDATYIVTHLHQGVCEFVTHAMSKVYVKEALLIGTYRSDYIVLAVAIILLEGLQWYVRNYSIETLYLRHLPAIGRWTVYALLIWLVLTYGVFASRQFIYFAF